MKKFHFQLFIGIFAMLFSLQVNAQDQPAPSPLGKVYQRVGVTDIEVTYSRPGVKGRTIFAADGLVPFGKLWRTGANAATKISFSTDVTVGGKKVEAGDYAIFTIPDADEWIFILNTDAEQSGTGSYTEDKDAARIAVTPEEFPGPVETMTFVFANVKDTSADLLLVWENTLVRVPIEVEKTW
jgi:hypothetical protein